MSSNVAFLMVTAIIVLLITCIAVAFNIDREARVRAEAEKRKAERELAAAAAAAAAAEEEARLRELAELEEPAAEPDEPDGEPDDAGPAVASKNIDYAPLVEMTRIITDNDAHAMEKMRLLARDYDAFVAEHQDWCDAAVKTAGSVNDRDALVVHFFALWLSGFSVRSGGVENNPTGKFCCYLMGDEAPESIIGLFEQIDRTLNYGLDFNAVNLSELDTPPKVIHEVSRYLAARRYTLLSLEAGGKGVYLLVVPTKDHDRVIQSSAKIDFKIYRQLMTT